MRTEKRWNGWKLKGRMLVYGDDAITLKLDWCMADWEMLHTIMQEAARDDVSDACLAGMVRALHDVIEPRKTLRRGKRLTVAELYQLVKKAA